MIMITTWLPEIFIKPSFALCVFIVQNIFDSSSLDTWKYCSIRKKSVLRGEKF